MSDLPNKDSPDSELPDEQQLDDYLRGGSAVSQQYRQLRSADVPSELDRLVLRQAQDAVQSRPAKSRTWMRWAGPLALAASAVLVVSIVIESGVHEETYLAVPVSAPVDLPARQEAQRSEQAQDKAAAGAAADSNLVPIVPVEPEELKDAAPAMILPEAPASAPAPAPAEKRALAIQESPPPPAPVAPQFTSPPPPSEPAAETPADLKRREQAAAYAENPVTTANSRPAAVPARARAPSQDREQDVSRELEEVAVSGIRRPERQRTSGPRNTIAAPTAAESANNADERADQPRNYSDPEQWLRDIRKLRKQNKHEEADREWLRFRYVFPNYEVAETDPARSSSQ